MEAATTVVILVCLHLWGCIVGDDRYCGVTKSLWEMG